MNRLWKIGIMLSALAIAALVFSAEAADKKSGSSSSSSWGGRSSSSTPSTKSSTPSWGGRSSSSTPSTKSSTPSWGGRTETKSSTPSWGGRTETKNSTPSWGGRSEPKKDPPKTDTKPQSFGGGKYGSGPSTPSTTKSESKPQSFGGGKYGSGSGGFSNPTKPTETPNSKKPKSEGFSSPYKTTGDSAKPKTVVTDKVRDNREVVSQRTYQEQQRATAPAKSSYTTTTGKTIKIDTGSKAVQDIRSKPSTYYQPEVRQKRTVEHIHHYHYSRPYDWYYSQPTVYVGGGYSSAFWYMMLEWDAERRAQWLYNHQNEIDHQLYQQQLQNAELRAKISALEAAKSPINPQYVDKEFDTADSRDLMYDQQHIEAIYNPVVMDRPVGESHTSGVAILLTIAITLVVVVGLGYLIFGMRRFN